MNFQRMRSVACLRYARMRHNRMSCLIQAISAAAAGITEVQGFESRLRIGRVGCCKFVLESEARACEHGTISVPANKPTKE